MAAQHSHRSRPIRTRSSGAWPTPCRTTPTFLTVDELQGALEALRASCGRPAEERIARTDAQFARVATVAEQWDTLTLRRFHALLTDGQFVRLLETERARTGHRFPRELQQELDASLSGFEGRAAALEAELHYSVVPIRKLS